VVLSVLICDYSWSATNDDVFKLSKYSKVVLKGKTYEGKDSFVLQVVCDPYNETLKLTDKEKFLNFTDGFKPDCILTNLTISINEFKINVPNYALWRVADVILSSVYVESDGSKISVGMYSEDGLGRIRRDSFFQKKNSF